MKHSTIAAEVDRLDDARLNAMAAGDVAALDALLDDRLIYVHSNAVVDTKDKYLNLLKDGTLVYKSRPRITGRRILAVNDDLAIIDGQFEVEIVWDGKPKQLDNVFIMTWVRSSGSNWRMLSWQSTSIPR